MTSFSTKQQKAQKKKEKKTKKKGMFKKRIWIGFSFLKLIFKQNENEKPWHHFMTSSRKRKKKVFLRQFFVLSFLSLFFKTVGLADLLLRPLCLLFHSDHRNTMSGVSSGVTGGSATAMTLAASRAAIQQRQRDNCVQKLAKLFADLHSKFVFASFTLPISPRIQQCS